MSYKEDNSGDGNKNKIMIVTSTENIKRQEEELKFHELVEKLNEIIADLQSDDIAKVRMSLLFLKEAAKVKDFTEFLDSQNVLQVTFEVLQGLSEPDDIILGCTTLSYLCIRNNQQVTPEVMIYSMESLLGIGEVTGENDMIYNAFMKLVIEAMNCITIGFVSCELLERLLECVTRRDTPLTTETIYSFAKRIISTSKKIKEGVIAGNLESDDGAPHNVLSLELRKFIIRLISLPQKGYEVQRAALLDMLTYSKLLPFELNIDENFVRSIEEADFESPDYYVIERRALDEGYPYNERNALHYSIYRVSWFDVMQTESRFFLYNVINNIGDMRLVGLRICHLLLIDITSEAKSKRETKIETVNAACQLLTMLLETEENIFVSYFMEFNSYLDLLVPSLIRLVLSKQMNILKSAGNLLAKMLMKLPSYFDAIEYWEPSDTDDNNQLGAAVCRILTVNDDKMSVNVAEGIEAVFSELSINSPDNIDEFVQATIDNGIHDALEECAECATGESQIIFSDVLDDIYQESSD